MRYYIVMVSSTTKLNVGSKIWTSECQSYQFFSAMLQRNLISSLNINLSFTPLEYLQQIEECAVDEDGKGYINLLVMLFSEYYQQLETGRFKIKINEQKYQLISAQFLILVKLERLRREKLISFFQSEYLFNPNIKTIFVFSKRDNISESIKSQILDTKAVIRYQI